MHRPASRLLPCLLGLLLSLAAVSHGALIPLGDSGVSYDDTNDQLVFNLPGFENSEFTYAFAGLAELNATALAEFTPDNNYGVMAIAQFGTPIVSDGSEAGSVFVHVATPFLAVTATKRGDGLFEGFLNQTFTVYDTDQTIENPDGSSFNAPAGSVVVTFELDWETQGAGNYLILLGTFVYDISVIDLAACLGSAAVGNFDPSLQITRQDGTPNGIRFDACLRFSAQYTSPLSRESATDDNADVALLPFTENLQPPTSLDGQFYFGAGYGPLSGDCPTGETCVYTAHLVLFATESDDDSPANALRPWTALAI